MQMQEPEIKDERARLERLIALMPTGERRAQYEDQLIALNAAPPVPLASQIAALRVQHDTVSAEWNRLLDQLDALGQDTPAFDALFVEWEKVDAEYRQLCDRIDCLELTQAMRDSFAGSIQPSAS
jgi:hypothetical protein